MKGDDDMRCFFFQKGFFDLFFIFILLLIIGIIVFVMISCFIEWRENNESDRIDTDAVVRAKRMRISRGENIHNITFFYATFEMGNGDRKEFLISGSEYGQLAEGDIGRLSFQGTRYLGFLRK